jgi:hypothetical protein
MAMLRFMRLIFASAAIFIAFVAAVGATGPSWPITPFVDYPAAQTIGPDGAKATVRIRADDDASAIAVEVYGVDGMRVGEDNKVLAHRDRLAKGASFTFDVTIHPGPGRSSLVVSAKARFARAGAGGTLREFPFGKESAEQLREHTRCVRQDPDGVWIRELGCDEAPLPPNVPPTTRAPSPPVALAAAASTSAQPLTLTIAEFLASPPVGQIARIVGYVVESYFCPPCPRGAQCKPCATISAVFVADAPGHAPFALDRPPADVVAIAAQDPRRFERGLQYRFEIAVTDRKRDHFDGRLLRSQRPDREPIWTDGPAATSEPVEPPPSPRPQ